MQCWNRIEFQFIINLKHKNSFTNEYLIKLHLGFGNIALFRIIISNFLEPALWIKISESQNKQPIHFFLLYIYKYIENWVLRRKRSEQKTSSWRTINKRTMWRNQSITNQRTQKRQLITSHSIPIPA